MRIIGGYARGIRLSAPDGLSLRPTEDRVKETVFSMLGDISGMTVADLFSGTGAMGLEALSRGAACVKSIELNPLHADFIQRNYDAVAKSMGENLSKGAFELIRGDVSQFASLLSSVAGKIDLILADPPYHQPDGVFKTAEKVYGIQIEPLEGIQVYHPEVEVFKVSDADGSLLGIFLTDYLPRSSKRGGAWMNNFRDQYIDAKGTDVRPIIVNVCNMTPPTEDKPSLITIDEVQTLYHEFGHALHGLLTKCSYPSVSGTAVARDFVETFSQFNENWAFQPEILALYAKHYQTGEMIPDTLVAKINNALKFNQGFMTTELCAASILRCGRGSL